MKKKSILWMISFFVLSLGALAAAAALVVKVDPFFHYHKPLTDTYYYELFNERSQNDGISRNFDYDALITGSSVTENFRTSEMDAIFGTHSVKVSYFGAYYKEVNDNLTVALKSQPNLKTIVRGLDMNYFIQDKDAMRTDQGTYPTYLYDDNLLNDVNYVLNRDVLFKRIYPMLTENDEEGFTPGIASFDDYGFWMSGYSCGIHAIRPEGVTVQEPGEPVHLDEESREILLGNIRQNVTSLASEYPEVTFYYFITPYSSIWWQAELEKGTIYRQIEAEQLIIEECLQYDNIRIFSFNLLTDLTTDMNNYVDTVHYASWFNTLILQYMHDGKCELTADNYEAYLAEELEFYTTYDYASVNKQEDYEDDNYAEALIRERISGIAPVSLSENAEKTDEGIQIPIEDISAYDYLVFEAKNIADEGELQACLYDSGGTPLLLTTAQAQDLDGEWHRYLMDTSALSGSITLVCKGSLENISSSADDSGFEKDNRAENDSSSENGSNAVADSNPADSSNAEDDNTPENSSSTKDSGSFILRNLTLY